MLLLVSLFSIGLLFIANKLFLRMDVSKYMPIAPPSASGCDESDDKGREDVPYAISRPTPNLRTSFGIQSGATVRGWPSTGGIYILESCDGVELEYLQLDRFSTSLRSKDSAEEDAHCARMRNLGAVWWKSEYDFDEQHLLDPAGPDPGEPIVIVGWPVDGGVWVLRTTYADSIRRGVGMVKNAFSMEERCRVIERIGGVFYADPRECPDLDLRTNSDGGRNPVLGLRS